jgi:hypothetical protein
MYTEYIVIINELMVPPIKTVPKGSKKEAYLTLLGFFLLIIMQ